MNTTPVISMFNDVPMTDSYIREFLRQIGPDGIKKILNMKNISVYKTDRDINLFLRYNKYKSGSIFSRKRTMHINFIAKEFNLNRSRAIQIIAKCEKEILDRVKKIYYEYSIIEALINDNGDSNNCKSLINKGFDNFIIKEIVNGGATPVNIIRFFRLMGEDNLRKFIFCPNHTANMQKIQRDISIFIDRNKIGNTTIFLDRINLTIKDLCEKYNLSNSRVSNNLKKIDALIQHKFSVLSKTYKDFYIYYIC